MMTRYIAKGLLSITLLAGLFVFVETGAMNWAVQKIGVLMTAQLVPNDDSHYAAKMNGQLRDIPACITFKNTITEAGKGDPFSGLKKTNIVKAYEAARVVGCKK